jgi:NADPH:quinone reductase-like Zn-dependent oxidoreductase
MRAAMNALSSPQLPSKMRAVKFQRYGGPEVLDILTVPTPTAEPGTAIVAVVTVATNPGEIGIRDGRFADTWPAHFPEGQGNDFAGYVVDVGPGITEVTTGQPVFGFAPRRAQAQFVSVGMDSLAAKPPDVSWEAAASIAGAGATAYAAVRAVDPQRGEVVVVSAAAGGVGSFAAQLARVRGATVIGTCGPGNVDLLRSLHIEPVLYGDGVADRIRALAPDGVDAFVDTFGYGNVDLAISLDVPPHRINTLIDRDAVAKYGVHSDAQEQAYSPAIWSEIAELVARDDISVPIAGVYDFTVDQVRQAYRDVGSRHGGGKRILRIGAPH